MIKDKMHEAIIQNFPKLQEWYQSRSQGVQVPFYASFDIRDSGCKIATVDANIFPAGFNNICQQDKDTAPELIKQYFQKIDFKGEKIALLTEEHTNNLYYWDNVAWIRKLLEDSGYNVQAVIPIEGFEATVIESASGMEVPVRSAFQLEDFQPDLVLSNNDFTKELQEWTNQNSVSVNPPHEFGWYHRRKDSYFHFYNELVAEFAEVLDFPKEYFRIQTHRFENFDTTSEDSKKELADKVDEILGNLADLYKEFRIKDDPFVFLKNNSGTYGLGVMPVAKGQDVVEMSYKSRKKMKAAKGGGGFSDIIVQEGIPSVIKHEEGIAEPVIYMIGDELAGGFLRTHNKKGATESLNSPGAVYSRMCLSDLKIQRENLPLENVYGWLAKIGTLAIAREGVDVKARW